MIYIGGLNQFQALANLTPSQHILERKKKLVCIYSLQQDHLENEQSNRKAKISKIKIKWVKKGEA